MRVVSAVTSPIVRWVSPRNGSVPVLPREAAHTVALAGMAAAFLSGREAVNVGTGRLLAALFAAMAAFVVPNAGAAEDLPVYEPRVAAALDLLDGVPATSSLRSVLASNQVQVRFLPMAPGVYARYSVARHLIEIDDRWTDSDTSTLAAVIAHEATHASDAVSGFLSSGGGAACIDSEVRAFTMSAQFWIAQYGAAGKVGATTELDRQLNSIADRELHDPQGLEALVRQTYSQQCSH
jgi:hypothetical protein